MYYDTKLQVLAGTAIALRGQHRSIVRVQETVECGSYCVVIDNHILLQQLI